MQLELVWRDGSHEQQHSSASHRSLSGTSVPTWTSARNGSSANAPGCASVGPTIAVNPHQLSTFQQRHTWPNQGLIYTVGSSDRRHTLSSPTHSHPSFHLALIRSDRFIPSHLFPIGAERLGPIPLPDLVCTVSRSASLRANLLSSILTQWLPP